MVKRRRQKTVIHKIKNEEGEWLENEAEIKEAAINFYCD